MSEGMKGLRPEIGLHPGRRLAKSMEKSPLKPVPNGSLPPPTVAVKVVPSSHPPVTAETSAEEFLIDGISHITVPENVCRMSKSHAPNRAALSIRRGTAIEFRNVSPVTGAELKSRHFPNV